MNDLPVDYRTYKRVAEGRQTYLKLYPMQIDWMVLRPGSFLRLWVFGDENPQIIRSQILQITDLDIVNQHIMHYGDEVDEDGNPEPPPDPPYAQVAIVSFHNITHGPLEIARLRDKVTELMGSLNREVLARRAAEARLREIEEVSDGQA